MASHFPRLRKRLRGSTVDIMTNQPRKPGPPPRPNPSPAKPVPEENQENIALEASRRGSPGVRLAAWIAAFVILVGVLAWALARG